MTVSDDILTPEEKEAIEELRERVQKELNEELYEDTFMFLRFLRARDYNLNQAEAMLRNHLQWRKAINIENIINDYKPLEVLEEYCSYNFIGFDNEGSIVRYVPLGNFDVRGLSLSSRYADWEKRMVQVVERDEKLVKEHNKGKFIMPGYVYIFDMKNLTFGAATDKKGLELCIKLAKLYQDNYPERLKRCYFINVSSFFSLSYSLLKKFFAPKVEKKFLMIGADEFQEKLLSHIDENILPAFLGGKLTDPDGNPKCRTLLKLGGPIPERYYLKNSIPSLSKDPKAKKLMLPRASFSEISITVKAPDSLIEWEFETKSKDVAFGVFLKERVKGKEKITELVPLVRLDAEFSETGMYRCEKPGTYILLFDNSYSWIRSKEIYYKTKVISPNEHDAQLES